MVTIDYKGREAHTTTPEPLMTQRRVCQSSLAVGGPYHGDYIAGIGSTMMLLVDGELHRYTYTEIVSQRTGTMEAYLHRTIFAQVNPDGPSPEVVEAIMDAKERANIQ